MEVLGHSGIGVTMNTYAHVLPELRQEAADTIDELFGVS
jgi:integrase